MFIPRLWSVALAVAVLGCYPDSDKVRHSMLTPTGGASGNPDASSLDAPAADAQAGPDGADPQGPLLPAGATADNCTDFGTAWCEKGTRCKTRDVSTLGGPALCPTRMKIWCENNLTRPPDSNYGPAAMKACVTSWNALSCDEWSDFDLEILKGPSCFVPGKRGEGAGCWAFTECGSLECVVGDTACGTCQPRVPADGRCAFDSDCQRGLACARKKCTVTVGRGGACDDTHPCRRSLLCRAGACGPKATTGEACDDHDDCAGGLLCNFGSRTCGTAVPSETRCSSTEGDGTVLFCAAGSTCVSETGMCVKTAGDNQACNDMGGPSCLFPAGCAGTTCRVATFVACLAQPAGPPPDAGLLPDTGALASGPNSSAELAGAPLGDGSLANSALSKPLTVSVPTPNPRFQVVSARALGPGKALLWAIAVKSLSTDLDCGVAASITIKDAASTTVASDKAGIVNGSVGVIDPTTWSDNCLQPGETGWIFGIMLSDTIDLYAAATSIELSLTSTGIGTLPPARVVPVAYQISGSNLTVTARNDGPGMAQVTRDGFSMYLLLDAAGTPLDWGFLDDAVSPELLAPGATTSLTTNTFFFRGTATKLWAVMDFQPPP
jgi:hypothetical protein